MNPLARRLDKLEVHGVDADRAAGEALMAAIRAGRGADYGPPLPRRSAPGALGASPEPRAFVFQAKSGEKTKPRHKALRRGS